MKIRLVEEDKDPYPSFIGKPVRIFTSGGFAHGVYRGLNDKGDLVLLPSVVSENYGTNGGGDPNGNFYRWELELPSFVRVGCVGGVGSVREEYLNWMVENWCKSPIDCQKENSAGTRLQG